MLSVKGLRAWYGETQALFGVSLTVHPGQVLALVGTNGAGKTTTVRAIVGLIKSEGSVDVDGREIASLPTHRRIIDGRLAVVHESNNLFGELTVQENLFLGLKDPRADLLEAVHAAFPIVQERPKVPVSSLSGGQRQMVALGKALLSDPRYLILDEPSLGLSPAMIDVVYSTLTEFTSRNVGVLLIEQNIRRAAEAASELQLISIGRSETPIPSSDEKEVAHLQQVAFGEEASG